MRRISVTQYTMDLARGGRVFTPCWLSASLGISILHMLLLAQAWQASQHALGPACLVSAWTLASLVGTRMRTAPQVWGGVCLACMLLWLGGPALVSWWLPPSVVSQVPAHTAALALAALVLSTSSTAWLSQKRTWPTVGERAELVRRLVGQVTGLLVAWMLPTWAPLIALTCCLPLCTLDFLFSSRSPLPRPGGVAARWVGRYWTADRWQVQLQQCVVPRNWRWLFSQTERSETARGCLPLTLLAGAVAVVLGCVWGAVPTPFAAGLRTAHALETLCWLLGGQIGALAIGTCFLFAARGIIGFPARLLPGNWRPRLRFLALVLPLGMAASLVALGLPFLQARWWLAVSLASYTLADAVWGILLPRLRPDLGTVVRSQRHLLLGQGAGLPDPLQLAHGQACEAQARLLLTTFEGVLIAVSTPLVGWMIDRLGSVDDALVMVGLVFALGLACAVLAWALVAFAHRSAQARSALSWGSLRFSGSAFPKGDAAADR